MCICSMQRRSWSTTNLAGTIAERGIVLILLIPSQSPTRWWGPMKIRFSPTQDHRKPVNQSKLAHVQSLFENGFKHLHSKAHGQGKEMNINIGLKRQWSGRMQYTLLAYFSIWASLKLQSLFSVEYMMERETEGHCSPDGEGEGLCVGRWIIELSKWLLSVCDVFPVHRHHPWPNPIYAAENLRTDHRARHRRQWRA